MRLMRLTMTSLAIGLLLGIGIPVVAQQKEEEVLALEPDPAKRREFEDAQRFMKAEVELQASREQTLRARHTETANLLAAEQTRWVELTQALDELERMLGRP